MQKRNTLASVIIALLAITGMSACTKTVDVGLKPTLAFTPGTGAITTDTTLVPDRKYTVLITADRAEDKSVLSTFEIVRTYEGGGDTSVYYENITGDKQVNYTHVHEFTTLKKAGTERYTYTVKNIYGVANQKVIVVTVK